MQFYLPFRLCALHDCSYQSLCRLLCRRAHKAVSSVELQHFPPSSTPRLLPLRDGEWRKNSTIWTCGKLRENWKGQKTPGKTSPRGRERAFGSLLLSAWIKKRWSLESVTDGLQRAHEILPNVLTVAPRAALIPLWAKHATLHPNRTAF